MTRQIADRVLWNSEEYVLSASQGSELFHPASVGVEPHSFTAGGCSVTYEVSDGNLFIRRLQCLRPLAWKPVRLFGREPELSGSTIAYNSLNELFPFTGGWLIARHELPDMRPLAMLNSPWLYQDVIELSFEAGRLVKSTERHQESAELRKMVCENADDDTLRSFIESSFEFQYTCGMMPIRLSLSLVTNFPPTNFKA